MAGNKALPNRQSIRKKGWDYTSPGWYFVTCNTRENRPLFGAIVNGRVVLSEAGRVAEECWREIPAHFPEAQTDEVVVMPNHLHGLLRLPGGAHALGDVVGAFKSAVSRIIGRGGQLPARALPAGASAIWHRNYWDVIVRDERALASIRHYIRMNPQNYQVVMNVGVPRFLGNPALLQMPKLGFLASRGPATPHGRLPLKPEEAVISGFLSPMERSVFKAALEHQRPAIWVKPWGLEEGADEPAIRLALEEGRLLLISPFDDRLEAPSVRRAVWCNHYVLAHCGRAVIGHLNLGGMLACILSEADPEMDLIYL